MIVETPEWVEQALADPAGYERHPPVLIVPVADLLTAFLKAVEGDSRFMLDSHDIQEIITQIFDVLLNGGPNTMLELQQLPKFNRMLRPDEISPEKQTQIETACRTMATQICERMMALGGWKHGGFPYAFHRFLGKDVVLSLIPY